MDTINFPLQNISLNTLNPAIDLGNILSPTLSATFSPALEVRTNGSGNGATNVSTSINGGSAAFSSTTGIAQLAINPINNPNQTAKWLLEATADFTGAGKQEILQRNVDTGAYRIWRLNASNISETIALPTMGANWKISSIANFDTNNTKDIFWQNSTMGENQVWRMSANGASLQQGLALPTIQTGFKVNVVGDLNGDSKLDIVWYNQTTAATKVWLTNGASIEDDILLPW